jgi:hypothetical protein
MDLLDCQLSQPKQALPADNRRARIPRPSQLHGDNHTEGVWSLKRAMAAFAAPDLAGLVGIVKRKLRKKIQSSTGRTWSRLSRQNRPDRGLTVDPGSEPSLTSSTWGQRPRQDRDLNLATDVNRSAHRARRSFEAETGSRRRAITGDVQRPRDTYLALGRESAMPAKEVCLLSITRAGELAFTGVTAAATCGR